MVAPTAGESEALDIPRDKAYSVILRVESAKRVVLRGSCAIRTVRTAIRQVLFRSKRPVGSLRRSLVTIRHRGSAHCSSHCRGLSRTVTTNRADHMAFTMYAHQTNAIVDVRHELCATAARGIARRPPAFHATTGPLQKSESSEQYD